MTDSELLDPVEARILGVLIEKELTTPDQYPLSLSALTTGCNQKSNRDPVTMLGESEARAGLERLRMRQLAGGVQVAGSRVDRFRHNARQVWALEPAGTAILAELLLRGGQSPGDLRARANRMAAIRTQDDLERELEPLMTKGLVARLAPPPGTRAAHYDQLVARREGAAGPRPTATVPGIAEAESVGAATCAPSPAPATPASPAPTGLDRRVSALEDEVRQLRQGLEKLAASLGEDP